jgi:hypothetical protein
MSISIKKEMSTKEKIALLKEKHQPIIDALGLNNIYFYPKIAYRPHGKNELYVSFFPSELSKGTDVYTEFVSRDYVPEDSSRTLWMWRYNPHWEEEYESTEPNDVGHVRYLVPVSELIKVNMPASKIPVDPFKSFGEDLIDDAPIDEMTIRDFATIMTGRPLSTKSWLNNLISGK